MVHEDPQDCSYVHPPPGDTVYDYCPEIEGGDREEFCPGCPYGMKRAYKLMRRRKDGTLGPLFINRRLRVPLGIWLDAEDHPTKGFAHRPGWHLTLTPCAPHLKKKPNRVWVECEVEDYVEFERTVSQGGTWLLAQRMKVVRMLG